MRHLKVSMATFFGRTRRLIKGIISDVFIRERLVSFGISNSRLEEVDTLLRETVESESEKGLLEGLQYGAKEDADDAFEKAESTFKRDKKFLRLALKNNSPLFREILLENYWKIRAKPRRLKCMWEFYDRLLGDEVVVENMKRFGTNREVLEQSRKIVMDAVKASDLLAQKKGEAQIATARRNEKLEKLMDTVDQLLASCTYALEDQPHMMEKLGVPVLSPDYARRLKAKRKKEKEALKEMDETLSNDEEQGDESLKD
ncbi:MAG: hypothetical protein GY940_11790 [bacterium]|nr:hypothetical protein [bacterium]